MSISGDPLISGEQNVKGAGHPGSSIALLSGTKLVGKVRGREQPARESIDQPIRIGK